MQVTQKVRNNPNATVGAGGGFLAVFITWIAVNVFHWTISAESGAIIATAVSTVALAIGRTGIRGFLDILMNGTRSREAASELASPPQPQ